MHQWQQEVILQDPHRFKVLVWHRRARKTTTAISEIYKQAHLRVGAYWHLFPTYREAKDAVWRDPAMLFNIIDERLIKKKNESDLIIEFKNGSYYQLIGSNDPDKLRGAGPVGLVLDEYDTMKPDVWSTVQPIIRGNGGWAWFVGTPKGKLKLFELYQLGQSGNPEWKSWKLKASESGIIPQEELENAKKTMSQALYNQEFECEFLEGEGSVFRNVADCMVAREELPIDGHLYVIGCDLAKVQDYTVITVYDRAHNNQVFQDRFNTLDWRFQKMRIASIAKTYNNALIVIDSTGVGDPITEDLQHEGLNIRSFKITSENKKDLIEKLSIYIEQKKIQMIPRVDTAFEFDNFSYDMTVGGRIVYSAREGFHDDIVISHALAVSALFDTKVFLEPELTVIQQHLKRIKDEQSGNITNEYQEIN